MKSDSTGRGGCASAVAAAALIVAAFAGSVVAAQDASPGARIPGNQPGKLTVTTREYDIKALTTPPAIPEAAVRGRAVWVQQCAWCHDGVGQPTYKTMGPFLSSTVLTTMGEDKVRAYIAAGSRRMPGFQYGRLDRLPENGVAKRQADRGAAGRPVRRPGQHRRVGGSR